MKDLPRTDHKMHNHIQILHMSTTQNIHDSYRWSGYVKKQRKNVDQVATPLLQNFGIWPTVGNGYMQFFLPHKFKDTMIVF